MKYKHILVALELSDESTVLIDRAVSMASYLGARFLLFISMVLMAKFIVSLSILKQPQTKDR